ncbi:MAG TPA: hypothetical protein PKW17_01705 [Smithellaceae bacterium]|nr:hypothetical protein [Smithellaceae bacterium]
MAEMIFMKKDKAKFKLQSLFRNIDRADIAHFLTAFLYSFSAFGVILLIMQGLFGLLIALIVSIPLSLLVCSVAGLAGASMAKFFYVGRKPNWNRQEKFQGDLDQVIFFKRQGQYLKAMQKVNQMLEQEPGFAEALFLKAQILWEGYASVNGANRYLKMAEKCASKDATLRRCIVGYHKSINDRLKNQNYSDLVSGRD